MNPRALMLLGIAMIFLAVGFIIYPINIDATDTILAWYNTGTSSNLTVSTKADHTALTGLAAVVGITPLLILLGFVTAGAITGLMGVQSIRGVAGGTASPKSLMMMGVGMIFMAVSLIIFPVVLDGVASAYDTVSGSTYVDSYTGLLPILRVVPLIVLAGFLVGGVIVAFFGYKQMRGDVY